MNGHKRRDGGWIISAGRPPAPPPPGAQTTGDDGGAMPVYRRTVLQLWDKAAGLRDGPQVPPMLWMPELQVEYRYVPILIPPHLPRTFESSISVQDATRLCCGAWASLEALARVCLWV